MRLRIAELLGMVLLRLMPLDVTPLCLTPLCAQAIKRITHAALLTPAPPTKLVAANTLG